MNKYIIILTGSNGFLGSSLLNFLKKRGYEVKTVALRSKNDVDKIEQELNSSDKFYKILNAGWANVKIDTFNNNAQQSNLELQKYFFNLTKLTCVLSFINFGSYNEYGTIPGLLTENLLNLNPISEYAIAKNMLRNEIEKHKYHEKFIHLRISNIYGPAQATNTLYGTLIRYNNKPLHFGACNSIRDCLYIEDFCNAMISILNSNLNGLLNIGLGKSISNEEFVYKIANKINIPQKDLQFNKTMKETELMGRDYMLSIEKIKSLTGWEPKDNFNLKF